MNHDNRIQSVDLIETYASYESDAKDPYEAKCHFLTAKQESAGLKHLNDSKVQGTFSESRNKKQKNVML